MIDRIDHFVLTVADVDETLDFYERVLGFKRKLVEGQPAALLFGGQKINVHQTDRTFEPKAARPTEGAGDFCLITLRPISEVQTRIETSGVKIEVGPVERDGAQGKMTSIYFRDPDGNLIEVAEYFE